MKKILVLFPGADEKKSRLEEICNEKFEVIVLPPFCEKEVFLKEFSEAEIVIGDVEPEWLYEGNALRWVQISWAGCVPYLGVSREKNLLLSNASGAYGITIAEHIVGLLTTLSRNIPTYISNMQEGIWKQERKVWDIYSKKALMLGIGDIGTRTAERLKVFGMDIVGYGRRKRDSFGPFSQIITEGELDDCIGSFDLICAALPGTDATAGLLSKERLASMKQDSILINVGRGSLFSLDDLAWEIESGHLYGAGIDVTEPEPLPVDHPIWRLPNVVVTPHVAGVGFAGNKIKGEMTEELIWEIALSNLEQYCNGNQPKTVDLKYGY